jgi:hypothetical protein
MRFEGFASLSKLKFFYGLFHQLELATSLCGRHGNVISYSWFFTYHEKRKRLIIILCK